MEGMYEENIIKSTLCGYEETNNDIDFLCIFIKKNKNHPNLTVFHAKVCQEWTLIGIGFKEYPIIKYKFSLLY